MNTEDSIELWKKRFSDRKLSGQKVNVWCEKNKISRHAYYYWHRKIQNIEQKEEKEDIFVEIPLLSSPEAISIPKGNEIAITWNDFSITISKSASIGAVAELMLRLVSPC